MLCPPDSGLEDVGLASEIPTSNDHLKTCVYDFEDSVNSEIN